ncbi:hypothetical protein Bca4012_083651 [Brassica carinata]
MIQGLKPNNPESTSKLIIGLLLNMSTMVKLILLDKQASEFRSLQSKKNRKFQVDIITNIIPKQSKGKLKLASSLATRFYFDSSIKYVRDFKGRIKKHQEHQT